MPLEAFFYRRDPPQELSDAGLATAKEAAKNVDMKGAVGKTGKRKSPEDGDAEGGAEGQGQRGAEATAKAEKKPKVEPKGTPKAKPQSVKEKMKAALAALGEGTGAEPAPEVDGADGDDHEDQ